MPNSVRLTPLESGPDFWLDSSELLAELTLPQRRIPEYFGYDAAGSSLFEQVTELPTYYLTATEFSLLCHHSTTIAKAIEFSTVVELGSGSAKKTRVILSACVRQRRTTYMPIDVSREMLDLSARSLVDSVPGLEVHALWGRYTSGFEWLQNEDRGLVTVAFLGSNIGNMAPAKRERFLGLLQASLRPGDQFLVTADLLKPPSIFEACYNDPLDRTAFAEFRLNRLTHINRLFGGDFALEYYYPRATFNIQTSSVEAHVSATEDQSITLAKLDTTIDLCADESLIVDHAYKYRRRTMLDDLARHEFVLNDQWINPAAQYGAFLFTRV